MLYLIKHSTRTSPNYFFANSSLGIASSVWAISIRRAASDYINRSRPKSHSVFSWIESGCPPHEVYALVAIFESDNLTQDFEAGIATFRENHPEYFL